MIVEVCEVWDYLKLMAAEVMIETCLLNIGCFLTLVASSKLLLTKTTFPIYILQINNSDNNFLGNGKPNILVIQNIRSSKQLKGLKFLYPKI